MLNVAGSPVNGEAASPPPAINDNRPSGDNLDTILFQLRQVTRERDELRKRLALASPGTTFDDCRYKSWPTCQVAIVAIFIPSDNDFYGTVLALFFFGLNEIHEIQLLAQT